ncbi:MAG: PDZ domain-containing protein, partial [Candidatus Omnitrophica bacterium]|nr:PDZ domain-containing protein [Candidatus Omnitrophota bacterium]
NKEIQPMPDTKDSYEEYMSFFEEIYKTMDENYYKPVSKEAFDRFIEVFNTKIYGELRETGKSIDYIRWRSAAKMIDYLKDEEDIFSAFYPPKPAKEYEQTALGRRQDLGIEGEFVGNMFKVSHVEPRSDSYAQGLRPLDDIVKIDGKDVKDLTEDEVKELLVPMYESTVTLGYYPAGTQDLKYIDVLSKEYFKQMVFPITTPVEGIYGLEVRRFNRKTAEDMFRYIKYFKAQGPMKGLIIDLRGNPGGPPLAAREISSFFLPPGDDFAYFQKKNQPKAMLDVPEIPKEFHYDGPMVILINNKSGSASELFSGILQSKGRAVLMGENSAGQVMLKSMFHFDDDSMVLLITARGHHPDGQVFSFGGLIPNRAVNEEETDIIEYATLYLVYVNKEGLWDREKMTVVNKE